MLGFYKAKGYDGIELNKVADKLKKRGVERTDRHFKNSSLNDIIIYLKIFEKHSQCLTEIMTTWTLTSGWKLQDQVEEMEEKVNALEQEQDNFKDTISELHSSNRNLGRLLY
ncbi:hypothetical protein RhiirA4_453614 [Rhizophagus irregularis]|uniref:Uncharacterized protein n=1 Tax=Rhizophagus irregularis TaxID=588596 RepID=A0A2I1G0Y7_9GLOM|nr:hypothetical protein RhiirA4_453614 [Rhizophagus irregularis]